MGFLSVRGLRSGALIEVILMPGKLFQLPRDPIASTLPELPDGTPDGTIVRRKARKPDD
jgi:hypothetical protein